MQKKQSSLLKYGSINVSKSTNTNLRKGYQDDTATDVSFAAKSSKLEKKAFQLYMRYYDKAGETVQILRNQQQQNDPLLWPTATIDKKTNSIENIPGKENINFNAILFLIKDKNREHELKDLIAKLHMGEALDQQNRQQIFEDIII